MTDSTADAALNLSPRAKLEILGAILLAMFLFALDQTVVGVALPRIVTALHGERALHLVGHDLSADLDGQRPDLRQAVRPLRPPPDRDLRRQPVPDQLGARRPQPEHGDVHPVPRAPGPRRRRDVPDRPRGRRRPVHAGRARQVPRPVRRRVRGVVARRARARRVHHRHVQLELDLLHQHPDRAGLAVHPVAAAARRSGDRRPARTSTTSARRSSRRPSSRS